MIPEDHKNMTTQVFDFWYSICDLPFCTMYKIGVRHKQQNGGKYDLYICSLVYLSLNEISYLLLRKCMWCIANVGEVILSCQRTFYEHSCRGVRVRFMFKLTS